jgi:hypothetical protein
MCVTKVEYLGVLEHAHSSILGGHFSLDVMAKTIVRVGIWWPTLFQDGKAYVKRCDVCQRVKAPICRDEIPLRSMMGS